MSDIWLASKSPRRRELLQQIGVRFDVLSVDVAEQQQPGERPQVYVKRLAQSKAQAGVNGDTPVLGADTIVVLGETVLEKPRDEDDLQRMFQLLSGQTHQVMTAVAICRPAQRGEAGGGLESGLRTESTVCVSQVTFCPVEAEQVARYWRTGEPVDKAGGYGIQGLGAAFVARIEGSYSNVVGLPLFETADLLARFNVPIWNT